MSQGSEGGCFFKFATDLTTALHLLYPNFPEVLPKFFQNCGSIKGILDTKGNLSAIMSLMFPKFDK